MTEYHIIGTSSSRGYSTVRHGWLEPPDAFLGPTSIRGWPRNGTAENPSTLILLKGEALRASWDRCADALRTIEAIGPIRTDTQWVSERPLRRLSALLGRGCGAARNDAHLAALDWIMEHALGPWRFREAMRLHRGWSLREASLEPGPGVTRTPEACVEAIRVGGVVQIDRFGRAAEFPLGGQ